MARGYYDDNPGMEMLQGVQVFGNALRAGQALQSERATLADQQGVNQAYEHIAQKVGSTGDISALDGDPIMNTRYGTMAAGKFFQERASTETTRLQMLKSMADSDDLFYQNTFRPMAFAAQEAFQKGDTQRFGAIANELSAKSPMPYQVIPKQDGNFTVRFRSSADGDWVDTGDTMTPQEVMDGIGDILGGEQKVLSGATMQTQVVNPRFLATAARYRMGTILGNAQALADPKQWLPMQKGEHLIYAIPQNKHDDYSVLPSYRVLDEWGGTSFLAGDMKELLDQGYVRADVKAQSDRLMGRGGTGKIGPGAGGAHIAMLNAGYIWDKDQQWYYKPAIDADGKSHADYSQPASREFFQSTRNGVASRSPGISGVVAGANDPLGMREQQGGRTVSQGQPVVPAEIPNTQQIPPNALPDTTISADTRQLAIVNENGVPHYYLVDSQGQREEISGDEAQRIGSRANVDWNKVVQSVQEVWNRPSSLPMPDWYEAMTVEERAQWEKNGKVPQRLRHLQ